MVGGFFVQWLVASAMSYSEEADSFFEDSNALPDYDTHTYRVLSVPRKRISEGYVYKKHFISIFLLVQYCLVQRQNIIVKILSKKDYRIPLSLGDGWFGLIFGKAERFKLMRDVEHLCICKLSLRTRI